MYEHDSTFLKQSLISSYYISIIHHSKRRQMLQQNISSKRLIEHCKKVKTPL